MLDVKKRNRHVYKMIGMDVACLLGLILLLRLHHSEALFLLGFVLILWANYLILRKRPSGGNAATPVRESSDRGNAFWLYVGSAIFIGGPAYSLLDFFSGKLPWTVSPALLIPLSLGIYLFRRAHTKTR